MNYPKFEAVPCDVELPEESKFYLTELGLLWYSIKSATWVKDYEKITFPEYWLRPIEEPTMEDVFKKLEEKVGGKIVHVTSGKHGQPDTQPPTEVDLEKLAEEYATKDFPNKSSWEYHTQYTSFKAGYKAAKK